MIKVHRFLKEYASHKKRETKNILYFQNNPEKRDKVIEMINRIVSNTERGLITEDEALQCLINVYGDCI